MALVERDPEYNPDLFEGDIMGVLPGGEVIARMIHFFFVLR